MDSADTYFGVRVADPFRWLEQYDSRAVRGWYEAEDASARATLDASSSVARYYAHLKHEVTNRKEFPSRIAEQPGSTFYLKRLPGDYSPSLYLRGAYDGRERTLVTSRMIEAAAKVTHPVILDYSPSPSGAHAVVIFTTGGDERPNAVLVHTESGQLLPDELPLSANAVSCHSIHRCSRETRCTG